MKSKAFIILCFFFLTLSAENLLEPDPFYEETLPTLLGKDFQVSGTYRVAYFARPAHFHPFSIDPFVSSLWNLCTGSLAQLKLGRYQTMASGLASKIESKESPNGIDYHVELKPNIYWNPIDSSGLEVKTLPTQFLKKVQLSAHDFKLYVDLIKNPYIELPLAVNLRELYEDLESIEVLDDHNFIVHWKGDRRFDRDQLVGQIRPIPKHIYLYDLKGNPFIQNEESSQVLIAKYFTDHWAKNLIVSCGPWKMKRGQGDQIELIRNESYLESNQALFEKIQFKHKLSPNSAWQAFKSNELDSVHLTPQQLKNYESFLNSKLYKSQEENGQSIEKMEYLTRMYTFIGWNQKSPLFKTKEMRQALGLAINQDQIINHFLSGFASPLSGPFMPNSSSYNQEIKPAQYDPVLADELLTKLGWISEEYQGVRVHNKTGDRLSFRLTYYVRNELTQSICQYIATALREIGIECILDGVDYAEFMERYQTKNFEALYMAWALGTPPEDLSQAWSSKEAKIYGSSNLVGFENKEVDALIEKLKVCQKIDERERSYHRIHQIIDEEQPYTFLYVPKQIFLYRARLGNVFIPKERQDLINKADIEEPCLRIFYYKEKL